MLVMFIIAMVYLLSLCGYFAQAFLLNPIKVHNLGLAVLFCSSVISSLFAFTQRGKGKVYFGSLATAAVVVAFIIMVLFMPSDEIVAWSALLGVPLVFLVAESLRQVMR